MILKGLVLYQLGSSCYYDRGLGRKNVLVQQQYCIETLARVECRFVVWTRRALSHHRGAWKLLVFWMLRLRQLLSCRSSASGCKYCRQTGWALTCSYCESLVAHQTGIQSKRSSRRWDVSSECSGCVTEDGQAFVIGAARLCMGRQTLSHCPMHLRRRERVRLPVALIDLNQVILRRNSSALGYVV